MLSDVVRLLACPGCHQSVELTERSLVCASRHSFDVARQGYVNLLPGRPSSLTPDTPAMVAARVAFLDRGHYAPVADALLEALSTHRPATVLDLGSGPGWYLARVLDGLAPSAVGLALDLSPAAARRAARCHPRAGAAVADTWSGLPMPDASVHAALGVFAPRNLAEARRVLTPAGRLVVATALPEHLAELREPLGLLDVEPAKQQRLAASAAGVLDEAGHRELQYSVALARADVADLVAMGPSSRHGHATQRERALEQLPDVVEVTVAVRLDVFER